MQYNDGNIYLKNYEVERSTQLGRKLNKIDEKYDDGKYGVCSELFRKMTDLFFIKKYNKREYSSIDEMNRQHNKCFDSVKKMTATVFSTSEVSVYQPSD